MRLLTFYVATVLSLSTQAVSATSLNCININSDLNQITALAESGKYRKTNKQNKTFTFDYNSNSSFSEYLTFARNKIKNDSPKATLNCPIETAVTKTSNKPKSQLTVLDLVSPFELKATNNKTAILLIHGLTDSPYLFHDLAAFYHAQNITVRTLLLPGHGTAPEALIDIKYQQWQQATKYAVTKMLEDFEQVYLGGFSTGGALILDNLLTSSQNQDSIKGVMLWAPASEAKSKYAWAAGIADWIPFFDYAHKGADIDFAKYESFPLNAGAQVHALMKQLNRTLSNTKNVPDIPLLTITSEIDNTINTQATLDLLTVWHNNTNRKTSTKDKLMYFGDVSTLASLPKTINTILPSCDNNLYCENIINVAHTSVTNAPENKHYGWNGSYRNCETAFGSKPYDTCKTTSNTTLGETTATNMEAYPSLQRLTFNPNFTQMTEVITEFLHTTQ